ncbi:MAG TPA: Gfo/Idh/MocA family oxidoreductase, partial [Clostridia bacterium]|nr:Gfo/Idh/MocA family oxidoreductase [Clostridia bacterium]
DAVFCEGHELRSVSDAQKCIDRGMHVHLDKPGGTDIAAFEKLLRDADEKGLTLQMGYMYRYNPAMRYILKSVRDGKLGTITGIDGSFSIWHDAEKRRWLGQFPGGMMFYIGCHIIDMIMLINGVPLGVTPFNRSSDWDNDGSMDSSFAVMDYPHGICTIRTNATELNGYARRRLLVVGTKGSIEIQPLECPTLVRETMLENAEGCKCVDASRSVFPGYLIGRYDGMMLEFAACARGEMRNPYSSEYELALQKVLLEACK